MTKCKITIESGNYKNIFSISEENKDGIQEVHVDRIKPLLSEEKQNKEFNVVNNITNMLIWYLQGGEK